MRLQSGTQVGPYQILSAIGAGGMGEVYRARDSRLGRDVAIKSLPDLAHTDPERVARFQREAQILASLNHPHIASIYGIEESSGSRFIVLELVEGETLAAALKDGPLPIREALMIARQVADALHTAHDKGIIHRDLKPANIALTAGGQVKVLDFGLAKTLERDTNSPTELQPATAMGIVVGTAAYMSPEQARGKPVDKRTDIWAFGCVLYELLTGRHPFPGQSISDTIAAILGREPDLAVLPASAPPRVRWLVRRCLEKDPTRRLHDIADARIELDEALSGSPDAGSDRIAVVDQAPAAARWSRRELAAWVVAGACLAGLIAVLARGRWDVDRESADVRTYSTSIALPEGFRLGTNNPPGRFTLSPDGRRLAMVATDAGGRTLLWVRPLDTSVSQPLAGTDGASFPFWSPDSKSIAFIAEGKLKRVDVAGGPPVALADVSIGSTGSWNTDGVILFTPKGGDPIYRVSPSGGTPTPVTTLDTAAGDVQHWYPFFLPDGRHFLYFVVGSKAGGLTDARAIMLGSLDSKEPGKLLVERGSNAKYANGHILFVRGDTLVAQPFDADRLELSGEARPIVEHVQITGGGSTGTPGGFTVSETGLLAYQTGLLTRSQLAWFDGRGTRLASVGDQADYGDVMLSPDGTRAAVSVMDPSLATRDLWIFDLGRGIRERFTFDPGDDFAPIWSRLDGRDIIFSSRRQGSIQLYRKPMGASGQEQRVFEDGLGKFASDWSRDGRFLVYIAGGGVVARSDLWLLTLSSPAKAEPFLQETYIESHAQFSPDGRWLAYMTAETGKREVFVSSFPGKGEKTRVSAAGGGWPRWKRDGQEIFYLALDETLTAVAVNGQGSHFEVGAARPLFKARPRPFARLDAYPYDVTADGRRFLVNTSVEEPTTAPITLVVNWPSVIRK